MPASARREMKTVSYTRMADMTDADIRLMEADGEEDALKLPGRLMEAVAQLEQFQGSLKVTRLEHSLQSATRAHRAGRDNEYVAAALLHDIGDVLAPITHGEMVAAVLRPFVSERICWIVQKHGLFQSYYYAHLMGEDRNARDRYLDHPFYDDCVEFCEHFDQNCFDPDYDSLPLEFFRPIVEEVFGTPRYLTHAGDNS
jgi:predicted HD phosphohydrolase